MADSVRSEKDERTKKASQKKLFWPRENALNSELTLFLFPLDTRPKP